MSIQQLVESPDIQTHDLANVLSYLSGTELILVSEISRQLYALVLAPPLYPRGLLLSQVCQLVDVWPGGSRPIYLTQQRYEHAWKEWPLQGAPGPQVLVKGAQTQTAGADDCHHHIMRQYERATETQ